MGPALGGCAALERALAPDQAAAGAEALEDLTPYWLPTQGLLVAFTCRWETREPLGVAFPPDASAEERSVLEAALRAWEAAGLGVRFVESDRAHAAIAIDLLPDDGAETATAVHAGRTWADCRVRGDAPTWAEAARLDAALARAEVTLARRTPEDVRGHDRLMSADELTGAAVHELGHALGFQGHVTRTRGVMGVEREIVARVGRQVLEGQAIGASAIQALYGRPSGTVLRRAAVSPGRTELADRLATYALGRSLPGPFARVGDHEARLFYLAGEGHTLGVQMPEPRRLRSEPQRLVLLPEHETRAVLDAEVPAP